MTPDEMEAIVLAAVARDRARRWGYTTTLNDDVADFMAQQVTDVNTLADVRMIMSTLMDAGLIVTEPKSKVLQTAAEWRDASLFTGDVPLTFGERLTRLDEATPALQAAVDELRTASAAAAEANE